MTQLYIIARPNGAGKTTASFSILPGILGINEFVNADEIARGLSPFNPESVSIKSGKIMLNRIDELISINSNYAFETTLSSKSFYRTIQKAQRLQYYVTLVFFYLESPELAIQRVNNRILEGGHSIPESIIVRRYHKGLDNLLNIYLKQVDKWLIFDNSNITLNFVAEGSSFNQPNIYNPITWNKLNTQWKKHKNIRN
ncbi:MAG: zeta toxin family protein [Saprospiraceae bacterium]|nr:zeta toxin family protein [Saprospiraceae bacterium]MBK7736282.1 zeta toxin family protein [Saprospiraceae bacterium]MBK7912352.1 zeta toxin family protein [Saprospiraceae bacterium]